MQSMVIGVGNSYRRDDGAGVRVARAVGAAQLPGVSAIEASGEGAALLEAWSGAADVVVIDAVHSGAAPGTVVRFTLPGDEIPTGYFHYSTHAFSVAEAVALGRELDLLPARLTVIGIEGEDFGSGEGLSAEVEAAVARVVGELLRELHTAASEALHA